MSWARHSKKYSRRYKGLLIVLFIVPTLLLAFAVKAAHTAVYKLQTIVCDGVDDDSNVPAFFALPVKTAKELNLAKPRLHLLSEPLTSHCRLTSVDPKRITFYTGVPLRCKQPLEVRVESADDPDAH